LDRNHCKPEEECMQTRMMRAIVGGVIGTLAMTMVGLYVAPMMGMPAMNPADMLAAQMGGVAAIGWAAHLMIGIVLAVIYGAVVPVIPGPPVARGALYGVAPWLLAQLVVMPMMGMGLFSSSAVMAGGSLIGHLVYGAVLGTVIGASDVSEARRPSVASVTAR
jgi:uncharacterized membrane protein YagU involved in acid resistance